YMINVVSFFLIYSHNYDLHSFPTRRSSDLHEMFESNYLSFLHLLYRILQLLAPAHLGRFLHRLLLPLDCNRRDKFLNEMYRPFSDRKSTRLNSSHVSISYAVFCLKKKKTSK